jgi:hypothetical protein
MRAPDAGQRDGASIVLLNPRVGYVRVLPIHHSWPVSDTLCARSNADPRPRRGRAYRGKLGGGRKRLESGGAERRLRRAEGRDEATMYG